MEIHLTNEQPPRLQVTCADNNEYGALYCAVGGVLARHTKNLELSRLTPNPSSQMVDGLKQQMTDTVSGDPEGKIVFLTTTGHQRTLHAAATVALHALETRLNAEVGLLAGCTDVTPMQTNIRSSVLAAGISAWRGRQAVFDADARPLEVPTANQG